MSASVKVCESQVLNCKRLHSYTCQCLIKKNTYQKYMEIEISKLLICYFQMYLNGNGRKCRHSEVNENYNWYAFTWLCKYQGVGHDIYLHSVALSGEMAVAP